MKVNIREGARNVRERGVGDKATGTILAVRGGEDWGVRTTTHSRARKGRKGGALEMTNGILGKGKPEKGKIRAEAPAFERLLPSWTGVKTFRVGDLERRAER